MVAGQDSEVLDLVPACTTAIRAVVTDQGAIAKEEEVRIRVEQRAARVAAETVEMPSIASQLERFALFENLSAAFARKDIIGVHRTIQIVVHDRDGIRWREP